MSGSARTGRRVLMGSLGWTAVALVVLGALVPLAPVTNPGVQDCGTPIGFLLHGTVNTYPDAEGRISGPDGPITLDQAEIARALDHPCSERVAGRAVPAGVLVVAGTVLGLIATLSAIGGAWRRAARAPLDEPIAPAAPVAEPAS